MEACEGFRLMEGLLKASERLMKGLGMLMKGLGLQKTYGKLMEAYEGFRLMEDLWKAYERLQKSLVNISLKMKSNFKKLPKMYPKKARCQW